MLKILNRLSKLTMLNMYKILQKSLRRDLPFNHPNLPQKYEYLWLGVLVVVVALATPLLQKVYIFQTHEHFENVRQGNLSEMLLYGLPIAVIFTLYETFMHTFLDDLFFKYYISDKKYKNAEARKKRCYSLAKWCYSGVYYLFSSTWAYFILRQTNFMPTWLGGHGSPYSLAAFAPRVMDVTFQMKAFYIIQFGKCFGRLFGHIFIRAEGAYYEYLLHHGLTNFLILFSSLTNQWTIGIFVFMLHDHSDFWFNLGRSYSDYKKQLKIIKYSIYSFGFFMWCTCRIFLFSAVCIIPSLSQWITEKDSLTEFQLSVLEIPYVFMIFMMMALQIMHIFWTYFILRNLINRKIESIKTE